MVLGFEPPGHCVEYIHTRNIAERFEGTEKEKINLSSVNIRFPTPPQDEDETYSKPRLVKLFCNHEDLDFSDIEEIPPSAKCIVEDTSSSEAKITCIGHKFQRLSSLQLLVEEPMDSEATRTFVNRISLVGHKAQSYHAEYSG
eukprot:g7101.t1